jgi:hypothetical protein
MATPRDGGRPLDTRGTGQVLAYDRKDGLTSWYLRVRAYGSRHRVNLGTELDGWTQARPDRVAERAREDPGRLVGAAGTAGDRAR